MQDYEYLPARVLAPAGATVYAMNMGAESHSVTSSEDRNLFDVQNIEPGDVKEFSVPATPGEYPFYCVYHGDAQGNGMGGVLVVSATTPPTPAASPTSGADGRGGAQTPAPVWIGLVALFATGALARRR